MIGVFPKLLICSEVLEVASSRHPKIFGRQTDNGQTRSPCCVCARGVISSTNNDQYIIESVDSISRDGPDTPISLDMMKSKINSFDDLSKLEKVCRILELIGSDHEVGKLVANLVISRTNQLK